MPFAAERLAAVLFAAVLFAAVLFAVECLAAEPFGVRPVVFVVRGVDAAAVLRPRLLAGAATVGRPGAT